MGQHRSNVGPTLDCQRLAIYQRCDSMPTLGQRCHAIWEHDLMNFKFIFYITIKTDKLKIISERKYMYK